MKMHYTLFLLWFIVSACTFQDHHIPDPEIETIYVAGYQIQNGVKIATLWKNGVPVNLTNGSRDADAIAIAVLGADVYVAGWERISGQQFMAKYWKNGITVELSQLSQNAQVKDIVVYGNDVYVAGYINNPGTNIFYHGYWKNGVFIPQGGGTQKIAVSGNDIYMSGYSEFEGNFGYLKNGAPIFLTKEGYYSSFVYTNGIKVLNEDVYVSGHAYYISGPGKTFQAAHYWKNQERFRLYSNPYEECAETSDLLVDQNGNAYISGSTYSHLTHRSHAALWKNTEKVPLDYSNGSSTFGNAIHVNQNHIFVAGAEYTAVNVIDSMRAVYWKDGMKNYVTKKGGPSYAHDIQVISK